MHKFGFLFIIFIIFAVYTSANADVYYHPVKLEDISVQLSPEENIKCKFKQEKYLKNIEKPIVSSGDFEFIANKGVFFHTTYPIDLTADYTNKNYKQINNVIKAVQTKKYSAIEKDFSFFYEKNSDNWILGMKPNEKSNAAKALESITITGSNYIKQITINQINGNKTVIWFIK